MRLFKLLATAGFGLVLLVLPVMAHHAIEAMYDGGKTIEVRGKVLEWRFVNPHPYLIVEVTGADGKVEKWDLTFGASAVTHLRRQGYTAQSFKLGEVIIAKGNPARTQTAKGVLIRGGLTRQDGSAIP